MSQDNAGANLTVCEAARRATNLTGLSTIRKRLLPRSPSLSLPAPLDVLEMILGLARCVLVAHTPELGACRLDLAGFEVSLVVLLVGAGVGATATSVLRPAVVGIGQAMSSELFRGTEASGAAADSTGVQPRRLLLLWTGGCSASLRAALKQARQPAC